ncbi:MAG: GNAT family N-acetyltransferase [Flavobacteriales bacterium]|nr:MAG: GNAT family N-acetyltransferase [Flavobacteriales bacterium]
MELRLERCGLNGLNELVHLSRKTFKDAFEKDNDPEDFKAYMEVAFDREKLKGELSSKDSYFFFAYVDDVLAGYIKLNQNQNQTDIKLLQSMELERIYVSEPYQGKKIGEWLLAKAKQITAEREKTFLWLGVWEKNAKAIAFYQRHGFVKFGTHPYYIGKDEQTDWLMRFDLINFNAL